MPKDSSRRSKITTTKTTFIQRNGNGDRRFSQRMKGSGQMNLLYRRRTKWQGGLYRVKGVTVRPCDHEPAAHPLHNRDKKLGKMKILGF